MRHHILRTLIVAVVATGLPLLMVSPASAAKPSGTTTVSIADASVIEVDGAATNSMTFRVAASGARYSGNATVSYQTADGTATAPSDYTTASGTVQLPSNGCRCANVVVTIQGDNTSEGTEAFSVTISNTTKGTIGDGQGLGTIYDNEGTPGLVVLDSTADEASGAVNVTVSLTGQSQQIVTVSYATADVTAEAPLDYLPATGLLTFAPYETSKTVPVQIVDDVFDEDDETFDFGLSSATNASIVGSPGKVTIVDDDDVPALWIDDVAVSEGNAGSTQATFTVTSEYAPVVDATVSFATVDGTATAGADYVGTTGTATILAGTSATSISIDVTGDTTFEGDEDFSVVLSNAVESAVSDGTGVATIQNDDNAPTALTLKVVKRTKVKASGLMEFAGPGLTVDVALQKKKGAQWVPVSSKSVALTNLGDSDGDTLPDAKYATSFPRPKRGTYRVVVTFAGATGFDPSTKTASFKI